MLFQLHICVLATLAMGSFGARVVPLLKPGAPCTKAEQCELGQYSGTRFCCAIPLGGKFCSECCSDSDCPPIPGQRVRICVAGYPKYTGQQHTRYCSEANVYPAGEPCFRNDMCRSGNCTGNQGQCGNAAQLPFGKCA